VDDIISVLMRGKKRRAPSVFLYLTGRVKAVALLYDSLRNDVRGLEL